MDKMEGTQQSSDPASPAIPEMLNDQPSSTDVLSSRATNHQGFSDNEKRIQILQKLVHLLHAQQGEKNDKNTNLNQAVARSIGVQTDLLGLASSVEEAVDNSVIQDLPNPEGPTKNKEWQLSVRKDLRKHVVVKLLKAMYPSRDPSAILDPRIVDVIAYARKVEMKMFEMAKDREEYFHLMADKIYDIQKELQEENYRLLPERNPRGPVGKMESFEMKLMNLETSLRKATSDEEKEQVFKQMAPQHFTEAMKKLTHEEIAERYPALWTFVLTFTLHIDDSTRSVVTDFSAQNQEIHENATPVQNEFVRGMRSVSLQQPAPPLYGKVEMPIPFEQHTIPEEINEGFNFNNEQEVTAALIHASQCTENCDVVHCARIKELNQHLQDCEGRALGCQKCMKFIRLICFHGQNCENDPCPVSFCLCIRLKLGEEMMKARSNGRKFRKERVGRRVIKKGEIIPCPSCILKTMVLTPQ